MGHSRLLRESGPVEQFNTPELNELVSDMFETMHAADGAGLAAPQIGVLKRVVIFGYDENNRYPDAPPVPKTVLINPVIRPLTDEIDEGWEGCLSVPGMRGLFQDGRKYIMKVLISSATGSAGTRTVFTPESSSMNAIIWMASSIR